MIKNYDSLSIIKRLKLPTYYSVTVIKIKPTYKNNVVCKFTCCIGNFMLENNTTYYIGYSTTTIVRRFTCHSYNIRQYRTAQ